MPRILYLGGTGTISSACVRQSLAAGWDVAVLNRGRNQLRPLPDAVEPIHADLADDAGLAAALAGRSFDAVADFCSFTPDRLRRNVDLLRGRTGQYIFISSASAYQKPVAQLPITESTPLSNPYWQYSRDKIAGEDLLTQLYRDEGFPMTIVRPSHTYDECMVPVEGDTTVLARLLAGKPVVVHGDGTSLWVLTYNTDFAYQFQGLVGRPQAIGQAFHITGDEVLTWNGIVAELGRALGVEPVIVHVASETIARVIPDRGPSLLGDKAHSVMFDNAKVRTLAPGFAQQVPFAEGARRIAAWHRAHPAAVTVDASLDAAFDTLVAMA
ncbi:MAG: NAD-dependent epimerase/dehydratase family protein [Propionibacteriaceae bacterium]|jgi:nucleoside-diphosphate-sugar epimerase|nr:NAD-dependent epimerase/dehydratase family protein [Propionibacteriaceae bacterium]